MSDFYSILKNELTSDPLTRGYSTMTDVQAAADLNTVNRSRNRETMTSREISDQFVDVEWAAVTGAKRLEIIGILGIEDIDPFGIFTSDFISAFTPGSVTIANLQAARVEFISRAEELGLGVIYEGQVADARRL